MNETEESDLYQIISDEHAKQLHWKETLKIETQQMKVAKEKESSEQECVQKQALLDRKSKVDLQLSMEDSRRKASVEELQRNAAAGATGETAMMSVAKVLSEFLSK